MSLKRFDTKIPDLIHIGPQVFGDDRGFFMETYHLEKYRELGLKEEFVQDNLSKSKQGVLRGLHYQWPNPQGKLVTVLEGSVYDVAVDIRSGSPTFGQWQAFDLNAKEKNQLYIPPGFAHGFVVTSESATFQYKCTDLYHPEYEYSILWNDPDLNIPWPIDEPSLSEKDMKGVLLKDMPQENLPKNS